ncbi:MAG TPA: ADOP family duplicated permease [Bryobacteraceae bacterium]|jgi:predicted permease|nr:ADOP family duplicated permease [Bryobacteraceae bacterium]
MMQHLLQDLKYSGRQFFNNPGFALTAIISLALGIGATTAIFSVIYAALINPYPYPHADRIVRLSMKDKASDVDTMQLNGLQVRQLQQSPVVQSVLAMDYHAMMLTRADYPENVQVISFIASGFSDLGVPALMGRGLLPSDAPDGQDPNAVAVLSYKFWKTQFFGDPDIVGKKIELSRKPYLIVGVARPRFTWYSPDLWLPLKITNDDSRRFIIDFFLKPGVTQAAANDALQPVMEQFARNTPKQFPDRFKVRVEGLNEWVNRSIRGTLYLLLGAVLLLLAIACGNVSILLLARGTARQHELGIRAAVGANRIRLLEQLLTESLLLSLLGMTFGVSLSFAMLAGIKSLLPRYAFAPEVVITLNVPVLIFSVAIALLTGVLSGLWPAFRASATDIGVALQSGTRRIAGSVQGHRTHQALVSGQIAFTLLLLTGAGAAMNGFLQTIRTPLGYDPHNVLSVPIPMRDNSFTTWPARAAYIEQLSNAIAQVPGVTMTAISNGATPPNSGWSVPFDLRGRPQKEQPLLRMHMVSPGYFAVLHITLQAGRLWNETEDRNCAHIAVVNRAFARRYFPNGDAIGHSLRLNNIENRPPQNLAAPDIANSWLTIIGIVEDVRNVGLRDAPKPAAYVPSTLEMEQFTQILVRSDIRPTYLGTSIRKQLARFYPDQQTLEVQDLETWVSNEPEWQQEHLAAWIFGVFGGLALLLAAVGLYSVVSYAVVQRTGEFGIRMALGAQPTDVLRSVFLSNLPAISLGLLAGLLLALTFNGILQKWAGGSSRDPVTLLAGVFLLCFVSLVACVIPAHYATKVDPMSALRFN